MAFFTLRSFPVILLHVTIDKSVQLYSSINVSCTALVPRAPIAVYRSAFATADPVMNKYPVATHANCVT